MANKISRFGVRRAFLTVSLGMLSVSLLFSAPHAHAAAVRTVTKTADTNDGVCDADCSLREAIHAALPTDEIVFASPVFDVPRVISLSSLLGDLVIDKSLTVTGKGADLLVVGRSPAGLDFRIFAVTGVGVVVTLRHLTVSGGTGGAFDGGAINVNSGAALTLSDCRISANSAGRGGGLFVAANSSLALVGSTVSGNTATSNAVGVGGGIHNQGTVTVTNSTISGNEVVNGGGGNAGGLWSSGPATVTNSTITDNWAAGPAAAGGILRFNGTLTVRNSIVAANRQNTSLPDVWGAFTSSGYNFVGNAGSASGFTQTGDQTGTENSPLDPRLGPLANNGGRTPTHRPQAYSPVIDAGLSFGSATDQRGSVRPKDVPVIANASGGDGSDIGAVEGSFVAVTKTADTADGVCDTDCSLREAIQAAVPGDEIMFASPLFDVPQTISLVGTFGDLAINKSVTVSGKRADLLTVRRALNESIFRVFNVNGSGVVATLNGMTITGGNAAIYDGGGINANSGAALTVFNCQISGNQAQRGGGIFVAADSSLTLVGSTVSGNEAPRWVPNSAGGIHNEGGLTLINSTISGNSKSGGGNNAGGIWTNGTAWIAHSTITNNSVVAHGLTAGGIYHAAGDITIRNSIIAANADNSTVPDVAGAFASSGYNLIGNPGEATGFAQTGDQVGTSASPLNPALDPLGSYGSSTPTHRLRSTSPALDKGRSFGISVDQAGRPRPVDLPRANASGGDGADIGASEAQVVPPPVVLSAVSRKAHGSAVPFDVDLPLQGPAGVECRAAGAGQTHEVVVTFANPVTVGSSSVTSANGSAGANMEISGARVTLHLHTVANAQTLGITLSGVNDGTTTGDIFIPVSFLLGDANGSGTVTASDIGLVKSQSGQAVTGANFRADVTANGGSINASDIGQVKAQSGTQLP